MTHIQTFIEQSLKRFDRDLIYRDRGVWFFNEPILGSTGRPWLTRCQLKKWIKSELNQLAQEIREWAWENRKFYGKKASGTKKVIMLSDLLSLLEDKGGE